MFPTQQMISPAVVTHLHHSGRSAPIVGSPRSAKTSMPKAQSNELSFSLISSSLRTASYGRRSHRHGLSQTPRGTPWHSIRTGGWIRPAARSQIGANSMCTSFFILLGCGFHADRTHGNRATAQRATAPACPGIQFSILPHSLTLPEIRRVGPDPILSGRGEPAAEDVSALGAHVVQTVLVCPAVRTFPEVEVPDVAHFSAPMSDRRSASTFSGATLQP